MQGNGLLCVITKSSPTRRRLKSSWRRSVARNRKKRSKSSRSPQRLSPSSSSKRVHVFPYTAIQPGAARPALPLVLHSGKVRLTVRGLVDSGADHSILPTSYASYLGINLTACDEVPCTTAGGTGVVFVHRVPLEAEVEAMHLR